MWIIPKQLHTSAFVPDTAALNLDSNESSQICAQSLFVRSKPSPARTWSLKWKRDSWTQHLSGRILRPWLGQSFVTAWTSSLAATPASHSAPQENGLEAKIPATSGRISQQAFAFFDQESVSLKTSRATLPAGCTTFCATWEDWVTEQRGAYSQRLNAERHTSGSESSSWPSPVASEVRQGFQDRSRGMKGSQESLTTVVIKGWPTPNAADSLQGGTTQGSRKDPNLSIAVHGHPVPASSSTPGSRQESWATPRTGAIDSTRPNNKGGVPLADQVMRSWATPSAFDGQRPIETQQEWEVRNARKKEQNPNLGQLHKPLTVQMTGGGKLNPRWVETLMGIPVGWTMPSCACPATIEPTNSDSSATV